MFTKSLSTLQRLDKRFSFRFNTLRVLEIGPVFVQTSTQREAFQLKLRQLHFKSHELFLDTNYQQGVKCTFNLITLRQRHDKGYVLNKKNRKSWSDKCMWQRFGRFNVNMEVCSQSRSTLTSSWLHIRRINEQHVTNTRWKTPDSGALTRWPRPWPGPSWWSRRRGPLCSRAGRRYSSNSLLGSLSAAGGISDTKRKEGFVMRTEQMMFKLNH